MSEGDVNIGAWVGGAIGIIVGLILLGWLIRWIAQGKRFTKDVRVDNKIIIVTGCNTGIGKETVLDLASRGATVYMACRDIKKCDAARLEIIEKTGNTKIYTRKLDLSSLESVRTFVKEFLEEESRLDILINNAGIMMLPRGETKEGFEMQIGVNHMGHFLLTNLLLDTLISSAPSRIVVVSSIGHMFGSINKNDLNSEKSYNKYKAYFQSKLANVLFARELSKKLQGTGVTVNSLHPGAVKTELTRYQPITTMLLYPFFIFLKTPKSGAQTQLMVALDPDLEKVSGKYFDNCAIKEESRAAQDDEMATWLWNKSVEWTKSDQRLYVESPTFRKKIRIDGKVVIVTGANAGIGKETAMNLAARGGKIYMACRNAEKAEIVRQEIISKTGNQNVFNRTLDLASMASVRTFVQTFLAEETRLDILINNAGLITQNRETTVDGIEMQIGVNHIGHFLLTNLLLDTLKSSAPSRVVVVSSEMHRFAKLDKTDLNQEKRSYGKWRVYSESKLANILFSKELSKKLEGTGVTVNSLHPGLIRSDFAEGHTCILIAMFIFSIFYKTTISGSQTTLAVTLDPDFEKVSGKYFSNCKIKKESSAARDDDMATWLWNISEEWTAANV